MATPKEIAAKFIDLEKRYANATAATDSYAAERSSAERSMRASRKLADELASQLMAAYREQQGTGK